MTALAIIILAIALVAVREVGKQMSNEAMRWEYKKLTMWRLT